MKNVTYIILFITLLSSVIADESIVQYDYGKKIEIIEIVQNTTGKVCLNCVCNFTLYNENKSFNNSHIMTNNGNGIFNLTLPKLNINTNSSIYPVVLICNDSNYWGISNLNGIRVVPTMFDFTSMAIIMIALPFLFAYLGVKLDPTDPTKVLIKWLFIGISVLLLIGDLVYANIIAQYTGIAGLPDFFVIFMKVVGFLFILMIIGIIMHIVFVKNSISKTYNDKN
jgi:uncharacterized membrane protein YhdT